MNNSKRLMIPKTFLVANKSNPFSDPFISNYYLGSNSDVSYV